MAIINGEEYKSFLDYLKKEKKEAYREFRKHYSEKRASFPELTEEQYLFLVSSKKMKAGARTHLQEIDEGYISEEEVKNLERILNSSPKLSQLTKKYENINRISTYLTRDERQKIEGTAARKIRDSMDKNDRKNYSNKKVTLIMRRLNIGPWKQNVGYNPSEHEIEEVIQSNEVLFKDNRELAVRILERYYMAQLQSKRNLKEAREVLDSVK